MTESPYMTYAEVCQFTHRSLTTVKRMVKDGRLPQPVGNPVRPMFIRAEIQASAPKRNGHAPEEVAAPAPVSSRWADLLEEAPVPAKPPGAAKRGRGRPRKSKGKTKKRAA